MEHYLFLGNLFRPEGPEQFYGYMATKESGSEVHGSVTSSSGSSQMTDVILDPDKGILNFSLVLHGAESAICILALHFDWERGHFVGTWEKPGALPGSEYGSGLATCHVALVGIPKTLDTPPQRDERSR